VASLFGTCVNNVLSAKKPGLKAQDAYVPYPGLKAGAPTVRRKRRDKDSINAGIDKLFAAPPAL